MDGVYSDSLESLGMESLLWSLELEAVSDYLRYAIPFKLIAHFYFEIVCGGHP